MSSIFKFARVIRQNWKKSLCGSLALLYAGNYADTEYKKNLLVREYCKRAVVFGEESLPVFETPRHLTVIINPVSNKKKSVKEYEKYCAPLLHLSGSLVTVLGTNEKVNGIHICKKIPTNTDAIIVAGGDGTVSEVITGILRNDELRKKNIPIGIIPLGKTNSLANRLYSSLDDELSTKLRRMKLLMDATFAILTNSVVMLSAMEIKKIDNQETSAAPIYAVTGLNWGAFREANASADRFWYVGALRRYAAYVFGGHERQRPVSAELTYTPPCAGCGVCVGSRHDLKATQQRKPFRWWNLLLPTTRPSSVENNINYEEIQNDECGKELSKTIDTIQLSISPSSVKNVESLRIDIGPESMDYIEYVKTGWRMINGEQVNLDDSETINAQNVHIRPQNPDNEQWLSIDNEDYEVKELNITLLHNIIRLFSPVVENKVI